MLEHTKPTADVYIRVSDKQRIRQDVRPNDQAYPQLAFTNPDGFNRVIRLKLNSNSIYQDEQIKAGILANEKITNSERDALKFVNGVLVTGIKIVQEFLEASPQMYGFAGICPDIHQPLYKLYDKDVEIQSDNKMFHLRLKAANKIASLNLEQGKALMIRLNGSSFKTPDTLEEVQNALVDFLDDANEAALDDLIRDEVTNVEEILILVADAIGLNIIDFTTVQNNVIKNTVDERMIPLKEISSHLDNAERERTFAEYLTTKDGSLILNDIREEVKKAKAIENKSSGSEQNGSGGNTVTMTAPEKIKHINEQTEVSVIEALLKDETRKTVLQAGENKIKALKG